MWAEFIQWAKDNNSFLTLLFSGLVAFSTIVYAVLTWKLVSETSKMRKVQTEPNISVIIQSKEESIGTIDMIIQNIGLGPAYDINFEIQPDFEIIEGRKLSEIGFIKRGMKYLAPQQKIRFYLTTLYDNFAIKKETVHKIKVHYKNSIGSEYTSEYSIDFSELENMLSVGESPIYKISKSLDDIRSDIHNLSSGRPKLKVITTNEEELKKKNKESIENLQRENSIGAISLWNSKKIFKYEGSVLTGTKILIGDGLLVSARQYQDILSKFRGQSVIIGDSEDCSPEGSLGAWLRDNIRRTSFASYIGPILIKEEFAEKEEKDNSIIKFKDVYPNEVSF